MVVKFGLPFRICKAPFKFFNFLADREDFIPIVSTVWATNVWGSKQFQVWRKLKLVKNQFKLLNCNVVGNISTSISNSKAALNNC